ncbi:MAG: translation initiation factor IF-2 [Chlamydiota bacterium]
MVKNLKINIKNAQLAKALKLPSCKKGTSKQVEEATPEKPAKKHPKVRIIEKKPSPAEIDPPKVSTEALEPSTPPEDFVVESASSVEKAEPEKPVLPEKEEAKPSETPTTPKESTSDKAPSSADKKDKKKKGKPAPAIKPSGFRDFREFKASRKKVREFDGRDKQGLRDTDDEGWRRKKHKRKKSTFSQEQVIRPKRLKVRLPITIKELAQEMKLKAAELVGKLLMQGLTLTINDYLDDETTIQLLGHEFSCDISIDYSEEKRLQITSKTVAEEIADTDAKHLCLRPCIVTFMGHVDHGKTSLIDTIRETKIAAGEAGAITQHIGAFKTSTPSGEITILDTPGHEAFSEMRERGANVTDIVVLVIAGDEGMRMQTIEAMNQAKEAQVPIVVAINKADKPGYDPEKVYRELADQELLPEAWGGSTICVRCSASTGEGIPDLLEMLNLQAEIQELRADPSARARGTVLESEMHKGLGPVATVLVQNGSLRLSDAIVLGDHSGRIKTMHDDLGRHVKVAPPATPVKVTGISGLVEAGSEFIVVKSEKEAKLLAAGRKDGKKRNLQQSVRSGMDKLMQRKAAHAQKVLPLVLRADVQGSLEALKSALLRIHSEKVRIEIVYEGVGEISESDVELAAAARAEIIGFHTQIESHTENLIKQKQVHISLHDVIYHAIDEVKEKMTDLLDPIAEESNTGSAKVKATFKSSHLGVIAGCQVVDGTIHRNHLARVVRDSTEIWSGKIASIKRVQDDVREVQKGVECGLVLEGFSGIKPEDLIQAYEIVYHKQKLS